MYRRNSKRSSTDQIQVDSGTSTKTKQQNQTKHTAPAIT